MRLWTLHPKYLDTVGLVALWREALLAKAVIGRRTVGYRRHPQLQRFRGCASPSSAINAYLATIHAEAARRGYNFDRSKLGRVRQMPAIIATDGQLAYEWEWLLRKLRMRNPAMYEAHRSLVSPEPHPLFSIVPGPIGDWERL
jgi:hypothetical protein